MTESGSNRVQPRGRTTVQKTARACGVFLLVLGSIGFIPGFVTDYDYLAAGSHEAGVLLLDTFQVSPLHNAVHLLVGFAGVKLAGSSLGSRLFLFCGGLAYAALCIYGLSLDFKSAVPAVPLNTADNRLHLFLGGTMAGLAVLLPRSRNSKTRTAG